MKIIIIIIIIAWICCFTCRGRKLWWWISQWKYTVENDPSASPEWYKYCSTARLVSSGKQERERRIIVKCIIIHHSSSSWPFIIIHHSSPSFITIHHSSPSSFTTAYSKYTQPKYQKTMYHSLQDMLSSKWNWQTVDAVGGIWKYYWITADWLKYRPSTIY